MSIIYAEQKGNTTTVVDENKINCFYNDVASGCEFMLTYNKATPKQLSLHFLGVVEDTQLITSKPREIVWEFEPASLIDAITRIVRTAKSLDEESFI